MRIVLPPKSACNSVEITDKDGNDLLNKIHVTEMVITLRPGEFPRVEMTCEIWEGLDMEFDYSQIAAEVVHRRIDEDKETTGF